MSSTFSLLLTINHQNTHTHTQKHQTEQQWRDHDKIKRGEGKIISGYAIYFRSWIRKKVKKQKLTPLLCL